MKVILLILYHSGGFSMTKTYRVIARILETRDKPSGTPCEVHKVGEEFDLTKDEDRAKICKWALNSLFPFISVLEFGGNFPWEPDPAKALVACPDPHNVVVFELERVEEITNTPSS
jgi:uncharacterized repeat protein (TIGR04076 family)